MPLQKTFQQLADEAKDRIREMTPHEVAQKLLSEPLQSGHWVLIDVRENDEFREGHIPGAHGIGRGVLEYHIAEVVPDTDTEIVLYCRGGNRSALAADSLQEMGYSNVISMSGGFREWAQDVGRPISHDGEPIPH
jgi:rhodanese-related sulfurtransferase